MRIPSGDLAPARRRRGGYGRRRRALPIALVLLLLAALGGGAYLLRRDDSGAPDRVAQQTASPCPSASTTPTASSPPVAAPRPAAALPAPGQVRFRLLNGTPRDGLAKTVGDQLAARGFKVLSTGNAPTPLEGATRVLHGPGGEAAARVAAAAVLGAQVVPVPTQARGSVDVTLGTGYTRLRTPAEAAAVLRAPAPVASSAAPSPSASPTCR